jgi:hypothetical protein
MSADTPSIRKLQTEFVISPGTQVVVKVAKALPGGDEYKPPGIHCAVGQFDQSFEVFDDVGDLDLAERLRQAKTTGMEDGTKIEARGDGWVVMDSFYSFILDPEEASWVVGDDDQDMPPLFFPTAESAYRTWQQSEAVAAARSRRREDALKRLGKC